MEFLPLKKEVRRDFVMDKSPQSPFAKWEVYEIIGFSKGVDEGGSIRAYKNPRYGKSREDEDRYSPDGAATREGWFEENF